MHKKINNFMLQAKKIINLEDKLEKGFTTKAYL